MADLVGFAREIPMSIKVAWVLWLAWSIVQAAWFRRARVAAPIYEAPPRRRIEQHWAATSKVEGPYDVPSAPAAPLRDSEPQPGPVAVVETHPVVDEPFRRG